MIEYSRKGGTIIKDVILYKIPQHITNLERIESLGTYSTNLRGKIENKILITSHEEFSKMSDNRKIFSSKFIIVLNDKNYFLYRNCFFVPYTECENSNSLIEVFIKAFREKKLVFNVHNIEEKISNLLHLLDTKDHYTKCHSERVADISVKLAESLNLDEALKRRVYFSGLLHDIGKIGIPDDILLKKGRLNNDEYDRIKKHCHLAEAFLFDNDFYEFRLIIKSHHEWYNGNGYPHGIAFEDIPLESRIIALADSYDAMTSNRLYERSKSDIESIEEIIKFEGSQFDPEISKVFVKQKILNKI